MILSSGKLTLRSFSDNDAQRLTKLANNEKIAINLRDGFPFPYTLNDAINFISKFKERDTFFAIEWDGVYVGNISLLPLDNVHRKTAEIGYFLGEPYWGKGIMTTAVKCITDFGFHVKQFARIHTGVYEYNPASMRVLEKCGFTREGIFRKNVLKNNRLWDEHRYALLNPTMLQVDATPV
jgi:ribosomal-protein-alanine N-acetyltransferase